MTSLRGRLTWSLALSLTALFVVQWIVVSLALRHIAENYLAQRLAQETEAVLSALQVGSDGEPHVDVRRVDPAFQRVFSGRYFVIGGFGGALLRSRSLWDTDLEVPSPAPGMQQRFAATGPHGQRLLVVAQGYRWRDRPLFVAVAEDVSQYFTTLARFQAAYGLASLAILLLLVVLQRIVVTRSLAPLAQVRKELQRLQRGEVGRIRARAPGEIEPLVAELNGLLDAVGERLRRSRYALGDLAHALKTQLALLTHALDQPEIRARPELRELVCGPVATMSSLVERELKRARLAGGGVPGERVSLSATLAALLEALQKIYAHKAIAFEADIPEELMFEGDQEDLMELAGNLLDNACKWCRQRVRVSAHGGTELILAIEDDGSGACPQDLGPLSQRGVRGDESKPGSGLGLAIAGDVAHGYGGTLRFERSAALGGLKVEVALPRRPALAE